MTSAFWMVWAGQFVSLLGSGMSSFALGVWLFQRTQSVTQFSIALLCGLAPRILLAPWAGSLIDRTSRKQVIAVCDSVNATAMLGVLALVTLGHVADWHIYVAMGVSGVCQAFHSPAFAALVPATVQHEALHRANGLVQAARSASNLLAPLGGGYLLAVTGLGSILILDLATYLVAVVLMVIARVPADHSVHAGGGTRMSLLQDTQLAIRHLAAHPGLLGLFMLSAAAGVLGAPVDVLLTPYVLAFADTVTLGWITAAVGLGFLLGDLAVSLMPPVKRRVRLFVVCEALVGVAGMVIGASRAPALLLPAVLVYFALIAISDATMQTFWQLKVPPTMHGRVFALREAFCQAGILAGLMVVGPLVESVVEPALRSVADRLPAGWALPAHGSGLSAVFLVFGCLNVLALSLAYRRSAIRDLDS